MNVTPADMLRLRALGGLWLESDTGPLTGAVAQRRRLALLSVLAAAGPGGVSRDTLLLLFWPESDAEHAAGALRQLLHLVRHALSPHAVVGTSAELRLNPEVVASDVGAFDAAVARGAHAEAARLYAGAFLHGFHVPDAPEFERWADAERGRRARQAREAIATLAAESARCGDHHLAVARWRALAALEPLDSMVALALMRALEAAGDRPGALQHARAHEARVRDHLGIPPDVAVLEHARRLGTDAGTERAGVVFPRSRPRS
jgi:serine/threonine-protein kinase